MSKHVVKISILFIIFSVINPLMANINSIENIELSNEGMYKKIILTGSEYFLVSSPIETVVATNRIKNFYKKNKNRVNKGLYAISLRDKQDKELFTIDIGNPFEMTIIELAKLIIELTNSKSIDEICKDLLLPCTTYTLKCSVMR